MASTSILHDQSSVKITLVEFYFMGESTLSLPWKFERLMDLLNVTPTFHLVWTQIR